MIRKVMFAMMALVLMIIPNKASAYEITRVIAVDSADSRPLLGTLRWSPDGTKLAYFKNGRLMLSDTLGVFRQVTSESFGVHMYEWLSDREIVLSDKRFPGDRSYSFKVLIVDVETGAPRDVDSCIGGFGPKKTAWQLNGPYRSVEGNVYYIREEQKVERPQFVVSQVEGRPQKAPVPSDNHILRWGRDGLYEIRASLQDSAMIVPKPSIKGFVGGILDPGRQYLVNGGTLKRLSDSTWIVLDTMIGEIPAGTKGCGIGNHSFNQRSAEVLFDISCDDGVNYIVYRIGTYSFSTNVLTILDPLLGLSGCSSPACAPDGGKIAFLSGGRVYIAYRGGL